VTTIGDNLPNENEIHEKYGTKNFLCRRQQPRAVRRGRQQPRHEFAATPDRSARGAKYGEQAEDLLTAMHEVIGHGSGKLSER
jgi:dipeptidyl-peptidase-3